MTERFSYLAQTVIVLYDRLFVGCQGAFVTSFGELSAISGSFQFFVHPHHIHLLLCNSTEAKYLRPSPLKGVHFGLMPQVFRCDSKETNRGGFFHLFYDKIVKNQETIIKKIRNTNIETISKYKIQITINGQHKMELWRLDPVPLSSMGHAFNGMETRDWRGILAITVRLPRHPSSEGFLAMEVGFCHLFWRAVSYQRSAFRIEWRL